MENREKSSLSKLHEKQFINMNVFDKNIERTNEEKRANIFIVQCMFIRIKTKILKEKKNQLKNENTRTIETKKRNLTKIIPVPVQRIRPRMESSRNRTGNSRGESISKSTVVTRG